MMTIAENPQASVIIAFYNRPDMLALTMAGLRRQTAADFELIIADDGSEERVVEQVKSAAAKEKYVAKHIWQQDQGFRKNRILNRAIMEASSDYLIFTDMDCIPHREFVNEHIRNRQPGCCLTGRRVNLSQKINNRLTPALVEQGYLESHWPLLICDGLFGHSKDVEKAVYLRSPALRSLLNNRPRGVLGCNFSLFKSDLLAINGFDERYQMPSIGEDSDVEFRLRLSGIVVKSLNHMAVQYHLFHTPSARPQENLALFSTVKQENKAFTGHGIIKTEGS